MKSEKEGQTGWSGDTWEETAELNTLNDTRGLKTNHDAHRTRDYHNKTGNSDGDYNTWTWHRQNGKQTWRHDCLGGETTFRALRDQMDIRTQVRRQTITDTETRPTSLRTLRTSDKDRHGNIGRQEYKEDSKVKILHNKTLNTKYWDKTQDHEPTKHKPLSWWPRNHDRAPLILYSF